MHWRGNENDCGKCCAYCKYESDGTGPDKWLACSESCTNTSYPRCCSECNMKKCKPKNIFASKHKDN